MVTALIVLLHGAAGYKAKRVVGRWLGGGIRRADQAKNKNGQSIEGMRKNMLSVYGIGSPHGECNKVDLTILFLLKTLRPPVKQLQ